MLKTQSVIYLILLTFVFGISNAQNSTIELISNNLSQPAGYKQIGKNHTLIVANRINNPSKDTGTITKPVVSVKSNNNLLTQSNAENKKIFNKPFGQSTEEYVTKINCIKVEYD